MIEQHPKLTSKHIDAALAFLPVFEAEGFTFGEMRGGEVVQEKPRTITTPWASLAEPVERFVETLYKNHWIIDFDWPSWGDEARKYEQPEILATADLEIIRKLLTGHVRNDRFCEGHLLSMLESGLITAILRRLRTIRDTMAIDKHARGK